MIAAEKLPPIHHLLGGHDVTYDVSQGSLQAKYQALADFTNPKNTVEGGMICAMLDDAMGILAHVVENKPSSTVSLSMEFLRPCQIGEVLVMAQVIRQGKSVLNLESQAWQNGKMLTKCQAVFLILS